MLSRSVPIESANGETLLITVARNDYTCFQISVPLNDLSVDLPPRHPRSRTGYGGAFRLKCSARQTAYGRCQTLKHSSRSLSLFLSPFQCFVLSTFPSKPGTTRKPAGPRFAFDLTFPLPRISAGTGMSRGKGDVHTILRG